MIRLAVCLAALLAITSPARAAFHLWSLNEIYTNSSGSLQFIELKDTFGGEQSVGGQQVSVSDVANLVTHIYTFGNNLPGESFNHTMLIGTAGIHAAGAPTPDFIMPDGFLFAAGGNISFFNASGSYTALPTDGTLSRTWGDGNAVNSPKNFAGQTGTIVAPEPATLCLWSAGICAYFLRRQRRAGQS